MVTILQQRVKDMAHRWVASPPTSISIHKPLLQCRSDPNAPPPYWENDPNLQIFRYGPRVQQEDIFYCKGGVNVAQLLLLSRRSLFEVAYNNGANVLLDERFAKVSFLLFEIMIVVCSRWDCTIAKSIVRYREHFRVQVSVE